MISTYAAIVGDPSNFAYNYNIFTAQYIISCVASRARVVNLDSIKKEYHVTYKDLGRYTNLILSKDPALTVPALIEDIIQDIAETQFKQSGDFDIYNDIHEILYHILCCRSVEDIRQYIVDSWNYTQEEPEPYRATDTALFAPVPEEVPEIVPLSELEYNFLFVDGFYFSYSSPVVPSSSSPFAPVAISDSSQSTTTQHKYIYQNIRRYAAVLIAFFAGYLINYYTTTSATVTAQNATNFTALNTPIDTLFIDQQTTVYNPAEAAQTTVRNNQDTSTQTTPKVAPVFSVTTSDSTPVIEPSIIDKSDTSNPIAPPCWYVSPWI